MSDTGGTCRIDVWLWRARFLRSRSRAAAFVDSGAVRLTRNCHQGRIDRAARPVMVGDVLVFAMNGQVVELRIEALGARRGGATEARTLYVVARPPVPGG